MPRPKKPKNAHRDVPQLFFDAPCALTAKVTTRLRCSTLQAEVDTSRCVTCPYRKIGDSTCGDLARALNEAELGHGVKLKRRIGRPPKNPKPAGHLVFVEREPGVYERKELGLGEMLTEINKGARIVCALDWMEW